jgi:hypothetical protein
MKTRQKEVGFQVLAGAAQNFTLAGSWSSRRNPRLRHHGPTACYEIYAAWKEGDQELARLKQERIAKLHSASLVS